MVEGNGKEGQDGGRRGRLHDLAVLAETIDWETVEG